MMIIEKESQTILKLDNPARFRDFMIEYLELLKKELQIISVMDDKGKSDYQYFTCGQHHDRRNPNWKPFKVLEDFCKRLRYDDLEAREIIEACIRRKLTCECELVSEIRLK